MTLDAIRAARYRLSKRLPYYGHALAGMTLIEAPDLPGAIGVDQYWRLYVAPSRLDELTGGDPAQVEAVLLHELQHLLRNHHDRAQRIGAEGGLWNAASDAEVNASLRQAGERLPACGVFPETLGQPNGKLAEEYYHALSSARAGAPNGAGDGSGASRAASSGHARRDPGRACASIPHARSDRRSPATADACSDHAAPQALPPERGGAPGAGGDTDAVPRALDAHGSGAGVTPGPWELAAPDRGGPPGLSETEARLMRRATAEAIRQHVARHGCGSVPGDWQRWAEDALKPPRVDWQQELAAAIRVGLRAHNGCADYTYSRRSRRQSAVSVRLPAVVSYRPTVAVVVDTSSSVADSELADALSDVRGIIRALGGDPIEVVACDSAPQARGRVASANQARRLMRGGGGTDMSAGIAAALASRPRPSVVVVLTDGHTPWPARPPRGARVVVVTTSAHGPAWAKTIKIAN